MGIPLIAFGLGYERPWRLNTWDRFAIPRPYSRGRVVGSPPIQIPPDLDRDGIEHHRQYVERLLTELTAEAQSWAERGGSCKKQIPLRREGVPIHVRRAA